MLVLHVPGGLSIHEPFSSACSAQGLSWGLGGTVRSAVGLKIPAPRWEPSSLRLPFSMGDGEQLCWGLRERVFISALTT